MIESRRVIWSLCLMLLAVACSGAAADERAADAPRDEPPLRFNRVYAPADQSDKWPRDDVPYLPIEAEEFTRLMKLVRAAESGAPIAKGARLVEAQFQAKLAGDSLVEGQASLTITTRAADPVVLPLEPCSLAVQDPVWQDDPDQIALLGLQASGDFGVVVERPGVLKFDWTAQGSSQASGAVVFDFELPDASRKRLTLDLGPDDLLVSSHGIVQQLPDTGTGRRSWQVDVGGRNQISLRVVPGSAKTAQRRLTLVRESHLYEVSPHGVELTTVLTLDVRHEPLEQIRVALDPTLRLIAARHGTEEIPVSTTTDAKSGLSEVRLRLPAPIEGSARIVLRAAAPLVTDELWRLPSLRVQDMFWAEGKTQLLVPASLTLQQLTANGCEPTKAEPVPGVEEAELVELRNFSPAAAVDVLFARRLGKLIIGQGTTIDVGPSGLSCRTVVRIQAQDSEVFLLGGKVAADWIVDNVESIPPGNVSDWQTTPAPARTQQLSIELTQAITPARPMTLVVTGRSRRSVLEQALLGRECRMLEFSPASAAVRLMFVRSVPPHEVHLSNDLNLVRRDPAELAPEDQQLIELGRGSLLFEDDASVDNLKIDLAQDKPQYSAQIQVTAAVQAGMLTESYAITCTPATTRIGSILLRLSQPRDEPAQWSLGAGDGSQLRAVRLDEAKVKALGLPPGGETWRIELRQPRSVPFALGMNRRSVLVSQTPVALAALPDASEQIATVEIQSGDGRDVRIKNERLVRVPHAHVPSDQFPLARAVYRYDALRDGMAEATPAIMISPSVGTAAQASAWVWSMHLDSRYAPNGTTAHLATFQIQSAGRRRVELSMPSGARLRAVWFDNQQVPSRLVDSFGESFSLELPPGRRFPILAVFFETRGPRLGVTRRILPSAPSIDLPIITSRWTLWMPPGYRVSQGTGSTPRSTLNWRQRLFGPLGRDSADQPFDPLRSADWAESIDRSANTSLGEQRRRRLLARLGQRLDDEELSEPLTWGKMFASMSDVDEAADQGGPLETDKFLVDQQALAELGISPAQPVKLHHGATPLERVTSTLEAADLTLIAAPNAVILTSTLRLAMLRSQASLLDRPDVTVADNPSLVHLPDKSKPLVERLSLVPAGDWALQINYSAVPWSKLWQAPYDIGGWSAYRTSEFTQQTTPVSIVRDRAADAVGWSMFLLAGALAFWQLAVRPRLMLVLVSVSAIAALFVPVAYVSLASGAFLGTLTGTLVALLRRRRSSPHSKPADDQPLDKGLGAAPATLLVMLLVGNSIVVHAAQPEPMSEADAESTQTMPAAPPVIHKVFIPVDEDRRPVGTSIFVPEALQTELARRAARISQRPRGWIIQRATYRGSLNRRGSPARLALDELVASFDLRVLARNTRVRIPFLQREIELSIENVTLDGQRVDVEWNAAGTAVLISVAEPGSYRLAMPIRPIQNESSDGGELGVDFAIPRLPTSKFELSLSDGADPIRLPTARGTVRVDADAGQLSAQLGAAGRLVLRWPKSKGDPTAVAQFDADQLLWLKVRPGALLLDVRYKIRLAEGKLQELRLVADDRLRLGSFDDGSLVQRVEFETGDAKTLVLKLKPTDQQQLTIDAQFLLTETSVVGNLRLPRLELLGARTTRRLIGISIDESLEYDENPGEDVRSMAVADFAKAWGEMAAPPTLSYEIFTNDAIWSLATRPRKSKCEGRETLSLGLSQRFADVRYAAQVNVTSGFLLQHRLEIPKALEVEHVSVREQQGLRSLRFSQSADGTLTVFLHNPPLAGRHELTVKGKLPVARRGRFAIPTIRLMSAEIVDRELRVFRQPDAQVEMKPGNSLELIEAADILPQDETLGRLVEHYRVLKTTGLGFATVSPNEPQIAPTSAIITRLRREDETWWADVDFRIRVAQGSVDAVRFEVPTWWNVATAVNTRIHEIPGEDRKRVEYRPRRAITGERQIKLTGTLTIEQGDRLRVPEIFPLEAPEVERYLVLPMQIGLQQIEWETAGLQPTALPAEQDNPLVSQSAFQAYQIVGDTFQASPRSVAGTSQVAQVRLADHYLAWNSDGSCQGASTFDIQPAGVDHCAVELPSGARLVQVVVAGLSAGIEPLGGNRFRVLLAAPRLPQRIEVLFVGTSASIHAQEVELRAPVLLAEDHPIHVERTLWTVVAPETHGQGDPARGSAITPLQQELWRLRGVASLVDMNPDTVGDQPHEQILRWYYPWAHRLVHLRQAVEREAAAQWSSPAAANRIASDEELEAHRLVARRLGTESILSAAMANPTSLIEFSELWPRTRGAEGTVTHLMFQGPASSINLRYDPQDDGGLIWRIAVAAVIALLGCGLFIFGPRVRWAELPWRLPHTMGVLIGLFWWLCLSPSIIGLLLAAISLVTAFRSGWHKVPSVDSDSTVLAKSQPSSIRRDLPQI